MFLVKTHYDTRKSAYTLKKRQKYQKLNFSERTLFLLHMSLSINGIDVLFSISKNYRYFIFSKQIKNIIFIFMCYLLYNYISYYILCYCQMSNFIIFSRGFPCHEAKLCISYKCPS